MYQQEIPAGFPKAGLRALCAVVHSGRGIMSIPPHPHSTKAGIQWVLRSKPVTPPEAFVIAAEFRKAADDVYACQQRYRDGILTGIEENWSGLASQRYLEAYRPIAGELRQLYAEILQRAGEIENIKIDQYWWEEVSDPSYPYRKPTG